MKLIMMSQLRLSITHGNVSGRAKFFQRSEFLLNQHLICNAIKPKIHSGIFSSIFPVESHRYVNKSLKFIQPFLFTTQPIEPLDYFVIDSFFFLNHTMQILSGVGSHHAPYKKIRKVSIYKPRGSDLPDQHESRESQRSAGS